MAKDPLVVFPPVTINLHPEDAPVVTLLTDFGARDPFVGVMKGVILRGLPRARIVDLTHEVPPQDVRAGAFLLESAFRYFPAGAVHVAVVDPGVGGARRVIAARAGEWSFLGPDNGLLSLALERACLSGGGQAGEPRVVAVTDDAVRRARERALPPGSEVSATFHGRDVFAPLAALMAGGAALDELDGLDEVDELEKLEDLGARVEDYVRIEIPGPARPRPGEVAGEVIHVDGFGNLVTNIRPDDLAGAGASGTAVEFEVKGLHVRGLSKAYVDRGRGELLALVGSTGRIEVSVREGSAAEALGASVGTKVAARLIPLGNI